MTTTAETKTTETKMTAAEVSAFLDQEFPQIHTLGRIYEVESVGPLCATMRLRYHASQVRPGGTISGPAMMTLTDLVMYVAILAQIGPEALTVTTNLAIDFLRKPEQKDLIAKCELVKLGKRLAVGRVEIYSDGSDAMVAHATSTYSIPPR